MEDSKDLGKTTRKEYFLIAFLFLLVLICSGVLIFLSNFQEKTEKKGSKRRKSNRIIVDDLKPVHQKTIIPEPFKNDKKLLENIEDNKYLKTQGFYYFLHKAIALRTKDFYKLRNLSLGWESLLKLDQRKKIRGKVFRIKGRLATLKRKKLVGKAARKRGIEGAYYWEGAIFTSHPKPFLFIVTDFPKNVDENDGVELHASFFKVWIYEAQSGKKTHAPFFIGKTLRVLPVKKPKAPWQLAIMFIIILMIATCALIAAIILEKKEASLFGGGIVRDEVKDTKKRVRG